MFDNFKKQLFKKKKKIVLFETYFLNYENK